MKENFSIVIPAYNEEENIKNYDTLLIPSIKHYKNFEVIVVDDGSKDNTLSEANKLKSKHKFIKVISYEKNSGMGYAIKQSIKNATKDFIIVLDSDLTFHPKYITSLLEAQEKSNADCVIGSHLLSHDGLQNKSLIRVFLHKSINYIYFLLFNGKVRTISSVFRLYRTKDLKNMEIESNGFNINAEILFKLIQKKKKVIEIPAVLSQRVYGVSKINLAREAKNHIVLILKILKWKFFK